MRLARRDQLQHGDLVHSTWRGHNKEWILGSRDRKERYLDLLTKYALKSDFKLHSYCVMSNHDHTVGRNETVDGYSKLQQRVHGCYAQEYNKENSREGAVGSGRPKSIVVKDERHLMNAMFYVDANPLRAGVVKHPQHYRWSSYNYYAFGQADAWTRAIEPPEWYLCLGRTPRARQRAYRRLCDAYLRREDLLPRPVPLFDRSTRLYRLWQRQQAGRGCIAPPDTS